MNKIYTYNKNTGIVQFISDEDSLIAYDNPDWASLLADDSCYNAFMESPDQTIVVVEDGKLSTYKISDESELASTEVSSDSEISVPTELI